MIMGSYLSIVTLNVNGLNSPTKREDWLNRLKKKKNAYICCLQETHVKPRDTYRLKMRAWKKIFRGNGGQKKAGVAIHISRKIDFEIYSDKRQRRIVHNDQRINPRRRYNN